MDTRIINEEITDLDGALEAAKYTADKMVKSLKKTYPDDIVKMAFNSVLNESTELFEMIYESACQLREDNTSSFVAFIKKLRPLFAKHQKNIRKWYGAAAVYRFKSMARDVIPAKRSLSEFLADLKSNGLSTDEVLTGEVYYDLVATNGQMQKVQDMISAGANAILGEYNAQNESEKQALLFNIRATWNQNIQKAPKKSFLDKLLGR